MNFMKQTVRDATYQLLREVGLTTVFGNPGSSEEPFLANFPPDFKYVLALQEASALGLAGGYAQATGKLALVNLHTNGGLGNAMGNLITAYQNKLPLIVTAGQQTREMLLLEPLLTNIDATFLPRPWVKWAYEPARAEDVPATFMRAIAIALQPPAGPVFLSIPLDDWEKPYNGSVTLRTVSQRIAPDPHRLKEFASALLKASSPVLIYGAAIDKGDGWVDAITLAEMLGAPVWAPPFSERVSFPENHCLYRGELPSAIGPLSQKLEGHDLAVVIGAPVFRYYPYVPDPFIPPGMRLLHISDDPAETARAPIGDSLLGDAVLSMSALIDLLREHKPKAKQLKTGTVSHCVLYEIDHVKKSDDGLLSAEEVFHALNEVRPKNAILVEESPSNMSELHKHWPITQPASFFCSASLILGWNLPAAVGIALAERDSGRNRPVVLIIGDGSFQYSIQSLWTAAQYKLPILIVVMCNGEYAILKSFAQFEKAYSIPGLDIPRIDVVSLAKGYGCDAIRLDDLNAIKKAASEAWNKSKPTVLEIPISPKVADLI